MSSYDWQRTDLNKFWANTEKVNECLIWKGSRTKEGYGEFHIGNNKYIRAHRLAWEISRKCNIPEGKLVLHICDNPGCINPMHLYCGTQSENMADRWSRNRVSIEEVSHPRFYEGEIWLMKKLYQPGKVRQSIIAKMFKTNQSTISRQVNNKYQVAYKN